MRFSIILVILCFGKMFGCTNTCEQTVNICADPVHPGTYFNHTTRHCQTIRPLLREVKLITRDLIRYIRPIVDEFANEHNVSPGTETGDYISMFENAIQDHLSRENPATRQYMQLSAIVHISKVLKCQLTDTIRRCHCIKFPDTIFNRIKLRVLGKWFIIQEQCGIEIISSQCDVTSGLVFDQPITCEILRDVIYKLLRYALNVLRDSQESYSDIRTISSE